jgi:hypothetical protein
MTLHFNNPNRHTVLSEGGHADHLATLVHVAAQRSAASRRFTAEIPELEAFVDKLISDVPESSRSSIQGRDTIAVGLVEEADGGFRTLVYTVAGNRTYPGLEEAAAKLGITRWTATPRAGGRGPVGAPGDAEQILLEAAETNGFRVRALAASRDFCADCANAVRAELGANAVRSSGGARKRATPTPRTEERAAAPGTAPIEAHARLTGAVEGAALAIHQAQARFLQRAEYERALDEIAAKEGIINGLRRQGKWVAITVVALAPTTVDLLSDVFTEPDQIIRFAYVSLTSGATRESAINPPTSMGPASSDPVRTRPLPEPGPGRKFVSELVEVRPPLPSLADEAALARTLQAIDPGLIQAYNAALLALNPIFAGRRPQGSALRQYFASFDLNLPAVRSDLVRLIAALPPSDQDLLALAQALGPWLLAKPPPPAR